MNQPLSEPLVTGDIKHNYVLLSFAVSGEKRCINVVGFAGEPITGQSITDIVNKTLATHFQRPAKGQSFDILISGTSLPDPEFSRRHLAYADDLAFRKYDTEDLRAFVQQFVKGDPDEVIAPVVDPVEVKLS